MPPCDDLCLAFRFGDDRPLRRLTRPAFVRSHFAKADPWRLPYNNADLLQMVAKGLEIPKRWTADEFASQGRLLILAIARLAKLTQRRAVPHVARKSVEIFRRQLEEVIRRAKQRAPKNRAPREATIDLLFPQHEAIWMQALDEVFQEAGLEVQLELVPPIQSVMAQGYSKVGNVLAQETEAETNPRLAREARAIASRITGINQTTRGQFERTIRGAIDEGATVTELAERLRDRVMPMAISRSMTIARTELNNAWTQGAVAAFQESSTLEYVSVIGCEAREPNSPQFRGESTCNIEDVAVTDLNELMAVGWHPNHTGTLIPTGFRSGTARTV